MKLGGRSGWNISVALSMVASFFSKRNVFFQYFIFIIYFCRILTFLLTTAKVLYYLQ